MSSMNFRILPTGKGPERLLSHQSLGPGMFPRPSPGMAGFSREFFMPYGDARSMGMFPLKRDCEKPQGGPVSVPKPATTTP